MMMSQNAGNNFADVEQEQADSAHDMNKNEHLMQQPMDTIDDEMAQSQES
jgi:hypothetical protein